MVATRAQALSSSADSVGNVTFTRPSVSGSLLLVTTPTTRPPQLRAAPPVPLAPAPEPAPTRSARPAGSLPPQTNRVTYGRPAP